MWWRHWVLYTREKVQWVEWSKKGMLLEWRESIFWGKKKILSQLSDSKNNAAVWSSERRMRIGRVGICGFC